MDPASSSSSNQRNRIVSSGERPVMADNGVQQVSHDDGRNIVSSSYSSSVVPSPDPAPYYNVLQTPTNLYHYDWDIANSGYAQGINTWDGYPRYATTTPEAMHVPPVVYNDNSSLMYQYPGYGFNPYPSVMLEGQIPVSPAYYPQPFGAPSAMHYLPSDIDPTSAAYMIPYGQYGGGNYSGNQGDISLTSHIPYPQTMGILGPYDHNASQVNTLPSLVLTIMGLCT
jgi:hypothetical protein